ncbi:FRG domain-containing protein, partial [Pseudomonas aeruginosa]
RFLGWTQAHPALKYLAAPEHVDALLAVLQHYGFPTTYIDFTTEPAVAGFFASDTKVQPEGPGNSVIYCLNTDDLTEFYECLDSV